MRGVSSNIKNKQFIWHFVWLYLSSDIPRIQRNYLFPKGSEANALKLLENRAVSKLELQNFFLFSGNSIKQVLKMYRNYGINVVSRSSIYLYGHIVIANTRLQMVLTLYYYFSAFLWFISFSDTSDVHWITDATFFVLFYLFFHFVII